MEKGDVFECRYRARLRIVSPNILNELFIVVGVVGYDDGDDDD